MWRCSARGSCTMPVAQTSLFCRCIESHCKNLTGLAQYFMTSRCWARGAASHKRRIGSRLALLQCAEPAVWSGSAGGWMAGRLWASAVPHRPLRHVCGARCQGHRQWQRRGVNNPAGENPVALPYILLSAIASQHLQKWLRQLGPCRALAVSKWL